MPMAIKKKINKTRGEKKTHDFGLDTQKSHTIGFCADWSFEMKLDTGLPSNPGEDRNTIRHVLRIQKMKQTDTKNNVFLWLLTKWMFKMEWACSLCCPTREGEGLIQPQMTPKLHSINSHLLTLPSISLLKICQEPFLYSFH